MQNVQEYQSLSPVPKHSSESRGFLFHFVRKRVFFLLLIVSSLLITLYYLFFKYPAASPIGNILVTETPFKQTLDDLFIPSLEDKIESAFNFPEESDVRDAIFEGTTLVLKMKDNTIREYTVGNVTSINDSSITLTKDNVSVEVSLLGNESIYFLLNRYSVGKKISINDILIGDQVSIMDDYILVIRNPKDLL